MSRSDAHEGLAMGLVLSFLGGWLDAYTYLLKGGVFANAQSGNVLLLAIGLFHDPGPHVLKYLVPVLTFSLGILVSEFLRDRPGPVRRWVRVILLAESLIILLLGILGARLSDLAVNSTVSFLAAMQVAAFRKVRGAPAATTMITGNLRSAMEQLWQWFRTRDASRLGVVLVYLWVILAFAAGAWAGSILVGTLSDPGLLPSLGCTLAAWIILEVRGRRDRTPRR